MELLIDTPVVTYAALMLATILALMEIALPTFGVCGVLSFALAGLGVAGIAHQGLVWWWLLLACGALALWAVAILRHQRSRTNEVVAGILFAAGSLGFAIATASPVTIVAAVIGAIALPLLYPCLRWSNEALVAQPPAVGMESLIGRDATVADWDGTTGRIRLDGSFWNADIAPSTASGTTSGQIAVGDRVVVDGFDGMLLHVRTRHHDTSGI